MQYECYKIAAFKIQKTPLFQLFLFLIILTSLKIMVLVFLQVSSIPTCQILGPMQDKGRRHN